MTGMSSPGTGSAGVVVVYDARVSIVRAPLVPGPYGGTVRDWSQATVAPVPFGVEVQPGGRMEDTDNGTRVFVRSGWRLIAPPGRYLPVRPTDRIRVAGWDHDLEVVGDVADWAHAGVGHTELELEETRG